MNKTVQLKDREGNNLYPKTPLTNVIGLAPGLDNRHIFFGSGTPSNVKSSYENVQVNDLYIDTSSTRDGLFYRVSSFYTADVPRISWDVYGYYFMKSGTPPTTGQDWSMAFGGAASPYPRKGLLWCDIDTGHIYEFIGEPNDLRWRCLTDNYSKSELDTMIAAFQPDIDEKADRIEDSRQGSVIALEDSAEMNIPEITLFGKSVQNGTPSIDNPVDIVDVTAESINITDGTHTQNGTLSKILRGIPVTGDNYTYIDQNNQKWLCDTIERYEDGSGKLIQRVASFIFNGTENWEESSTEGSNFRLRLLMPRTILPADINVNNNQSLMSCLPLGNNGSTYRNPNIYAIVDMSSAQSVIYCTPQQNNVAMTAEQWKAYLSNNNATMLAVLIAPIETPLTAEELAQLDLSTYYPITNITSNPDIKITYVADTKNYFDKKLEQVQNAIISNGGNV